MRNSPIDSASVVEPTRSRNSSTRCSRVGLRYRPIITLKSTRLPIRRVSSKSAPITTDGKGDADDARETGGEPRGLDPMAIEYDFQANGDRRNDNRHDRGLHDDLDDE